MKLKFKHQAYQTRSVEAITDCFKGQPLSNGIQYRIDPGKIKAAGQQSLIENDGFINDIVALNEVQLLANIHAVQRRQNLPLSEALVSSKVSPINLDS